jgi:hypothetical protein
MLFGYCQAAHCNVKLASIGVLFYDVKVSSAPTLLTLNGCALDANGHLTLVGSGESAPVFFCFFFGRIIMIDFGFNYILCWLGAFV